MTKNLIVISPPFRVAVGVMLVLLSVPSFTAKAVMWEFHGVDDRALAVVLVVLGSWAIYDGVRGLLMAGSAKVGK